MGSDIFNKKPNGRTKDDRCCGRGRRDTTAYSGAAQPAEPKLRPASPLSATSTDARTHQPALSDYASLKIKPSTPGFWQACRNLLFTRRAARALAEVLTATGAVTRRDMVVMAAIVARFICTRAK